MSNSDDASDGVLRPMAVLPTDLYFGKYNAGGGRVAGNGPTSLEHRVTGTTTINTGIYLWRISGATALVVFPTIAAPNRIVAEVVPDGIQFTVSDAGGTLTDSGFQFMALR